MNDLSQGSFALLIGTSIAGFLSWFNKYGSDFKDIFKPKSNKMKDKKKLTCPKSFQIN